MASLADLFQPTGVAPQFAIAEDNIQGGYASADANLGQKRLSRNYQQSLQDEANNEAARGSFYSGGAGVRADRTKQNYLDQSSDINRQLQRSLADLARNRIYATLGVSV
jgi:hypothetical protein